MKIQANTTTFQFSGHERIAQSNQTIKESVPKLYEQPVKVSISKEGYENYRNSISGGRSYDDVIKQKEDLKAVNLSADLNYSFKFVIAESGGSRAPVSMQERLNGFAETYMSLYDEIVQGYENGTRKINVADIGSKEGYRTLTMEEEISALDKAYENAVSTVEALAKREPEIQKAIEDYRNKLAQIGMRSERADAYLEWSKTNLENMPENIYDGMIAARDGWKNNYSALSKSAAWQGMLSVIGSMFR